MRISIGFAAIFVGVTMMVTAAEVRGAHHFGYNADKVLVVDYTRKVFPIGFTVPPPPAALTPTGKNGIQELHDAGALFMRTGLNTSWDAAGLAIEQSYEDAAAKYGMFCQLWLRDLAESSTSDATLKTVINKFKSHNGLAVWKGSDEP